MNYRRPVVDKLRAMADQDVSPYEAEIARGKLLAMGAGDREPPSRPPAAAAMPQWSGWWMPSAHSATNSTVGTTAGTFTNIHFTVRNSA